MDFQWVAIALGDVVWIAVAFVFGLLARAVRLPPLVGFLAAGFVLQLLGGVSGDVLQKLADIGITMLLFTVGLKLDVGALLKPRIWAITGLHIALVMGLFGGALLLLATLNVPLIAELDRAGVGVVAFAVSFSSTVFVAKILERQGAMVSVHGQVAIGILIVQDLAAVAYLAFSTGQWPTPWSVLVVLLFPLRHALRRILEGIGHGELQVLYGILLALGGAQLFELVGLKGDLGALILGVLIAPHARADDLAKTMLSFKDLFLLGFFLSIGLVAELSTNAVLIGVLLAPLALVKAGLFTALMVGFRLRVRTAILASANLANYSEFGLIVAAVAVANGWLAADWLVVIAIALALSFVMAAAMSDGTNSLYTRHRRNLLRWQRARRLDDDPAIGVDHATIAIIGMGGVGTGAYERMQERYGQTVVGIDVDPRIVERHRAAGRHVIAGDPSDADFWDRLDEDHTLKLVMLALPKMATSLAVLEQLRLTGFTGTTAVTARFPDEVPELEQAGASTVFDVNTEAGAGFAAHVAATRAETP